jgi:hypothetical protein
MAKKKIQKPRSRMERRFVPRSTASPTVIYVIGALGALVLGAGVWAQFGNAFRKVQLEPVSWAPWVLAAGAILVGVAIWIGTSSAAAIRVGVAGIAEERNPVRRIPWWRVDDVSGDADIVTVHGKDEAGNDQTITVSRRALPDAIPWVVREARDRAPEQVEISSAAIKVIGKPSKHAGEIVPCPPLQVVGRRCAKSDKVVSYEPDARVCPRCERVYHKDHLPKSCVCGQSLADVGAEAASA